MSALLENSPYRNKKLEDVIHKLDYISEPLAMFDEVDPEKIFKKISSLENLNETELNHDKNLLFERLCNHNKYPDDQYHLLAHLFLSVRQDIPKEKFDEKREKQNVDGVASLLVGDTKEITTGRGKSSVIAPVFLLFKSLWTENSKEPIIFSAPNKNLLKEAVTNYDKLRNKVTSGLNDQIKDRAERKLRRIVDEQKEESKKIDLISNLIDPIDGLTEAYFNNIPIVFQTHNQTIFSLTEMANIQGGEKDTVPTTLFDEMHQLTDEAFISTSRKEPRKPKVNPESFTGTALGQDISAFAISKILYRKLSSNENNFVYQDNSLSLSEKGEKMVRNYSAYLDECLYLGSEDLSNIVEQFILPGLQFKPEKKEVIIKSILNNIKTYWEAIGVNENVITERIEDRKSEYLVGLANSIANIMGGIKSGEEYIIKKSEITVRESGRGITLPSHQYNADTSFFIRVIDDNLQYEYRAGTDRLRYSYSFASWMIHIARGKSQGLTANLFTDDLRTRKRSKGKLASIIDTFSRGKAIPSDETKKIFPIPEPEIFDDNKSLIKAINHPNNNIAEFDQRMIICYNDFLAQKITRESGKENVGIIISTTSENEIIKILKRFAEGKIKTIITSGRAGYGVDIKKPNGDFPNFHITIVNPERQLDIKQGFGRLRAESGPENFSIFLTEDFLNRISTVFSDQKPLPLPQYHTIHEFRKSLTDYKSGKNKDKFIDLFFEALSINDQKSFADFVFNSELELNFWEKIAPVVSEVKKEIFKKILEDKKSHLYQLIDVAVSKSPEKEFIREQLSNDLIDYLSYPDESMLENYLKEASLMKMQPTVYGSEELRIINTLIDSWYERLVGEEDTYRRFYTNLFQNVEYIRQEVPQALIQAKLKFYEYIVPRLKNQLPLNEINLAKIENVSIEPIPILKERSGPKFLLAKIDPQKFIKIGVDKYLIVVPDREGEKQSSYLWSGPLPKKDSTINVSYIESEAGAKKTQEITTNNVFWVYPTVGDTDKIVTHVIMIDYKNN